MNKFTQIVFVLNMALLPACQEPTAAENLQEQAKQEIRQAEADFSALAAREGVPAAFLAYAADDAVLLRSEQLITGKGEMKTYFAASTLTEVKLQWTPDFVDASTSGDLGYTYGKYQFSAVDSTGQPLDATGYFHTVWKKQTDGTWKFVWD
ncbi:MAG: nuclear transport factor 2 family protein [Lewinellaceae bacterium]|nr:nuclear transport factor 2 family protein [Lewinellaceae bacterium]